MVNFLKMYLCLFSSFGGKAPTLIAGKGQPTGSRPSPTKPNLTWMRQIRFTLSKYERDNHPPYRRSHDCRASRLRSSHDSGVSLDSPRRFYICLAYKFYGCNLVHFDRAFDSGDIQSSFGLFCNPPWGKEIRGQPVGNDRGLSGWSHRIFFSKTNRVKLLYTTP